MTTRLSVLDSQLNCWIYAYHITFELDVEDLVEACTPKELDILLYYETHNPINNNPTYE